MTNETSETTVPVVSEGVNPASGVHSNVTVNLKAREALAVAAFLRGPEHWTCDTDAQAAFDKLFAAADRACVPWRERT